jgi:hypothetical protein
MIEHPALGLVHGFFFPEPLDFLMKNSRIHDLLDVVLTTDFFFRLIDRYCTWAVVLNKYH